MKRAIIFAVLLLPLPQAASADDAGTLHAALQTICPITRVTIGDLSDRRTWSVVYDPACTTAQKTQAAALIAARDMTLTVPPSASRAQIMIALSNAGHLTRIQTWVDGQDAVSKLAWANAAHFNRHSTVLRAAAAGLGLTSAQVDQIFIAAGAINP